MARAATELDRIARLPRRRCGARCAWCAGGASGLLAHPASVDAELRHARAAAAARAVRELTALFGPEHGVRGEAQDMIGVDRAAQEPVPVHSLYGDTLRALTPTPARLRRARRAGLRPAGRRQPLLHVRVDDGAGDARVRARAGVAFIVLDRPNPLGGVRDRGRAAAPGLRVVRRPVAVPVATA